MAKKKKHKTTPHKTTPTETFPASPPDSSAPVSENLSLSLRLPGALAAKCRSCAAYHGISMNALVCMALGDFLRERGFD